MHEHFFVLLDKKNYQQILIVSCINFLYDFFFQPPNQSYNLLCYWIVVFREK